MICDNCKNNYATKKCITSINDKTEVLYLCNECYAELYNNSYNDEANFFTNIFNNAFNGLNINRDKQCSVCKTRLSDFNKTGIVGCENCYKTFSDEIGSVIKKMQGKTVHTGKVPKNLKSLYELVEEKNNMIKEWEKAKNQKNFEEAKKLNIEIQEITKHINSLGNKGNR